MEAKHALFYAAREAVQRAEQRAWELSLRGETLDPEAENLYLRMVREWRNGAYWHAEMAALAPLDELTLD